MVATKEDIYAESDLSAEDWAFLLCFQHPVAFREVMLEAPDAPGEPYRLWPCQYAYALVPSYVSCGGRDTGKTEVGLRTDILFQGMNNSDGGVLTTRARIHLENALEDLIRRIRRDPFLDMFIATVKDTGGRDPIRRNPYSIAFATGFDFLGLAMAEEGTNIKGIHVKNWWGDETQMFTVEGWDSMQQSMKGGSPRERYHGVPDGRREVFWQLDTTVNRFKNLRLKLPTQYNPDWGEVMQDRLIDSYGGEETDSYKQNVFGEHGAASRGVWDTDVIQLRNVLTTKKIMDGRWFEITRKDFDSGQWKEHCKLIPKGDGGATVIGMDCGFVAPSVVGIFEQQDSGAWELLGRLNLLRIRYDYQADILLFLARRYKIRALGLDCSGPDGNGIADCILRFTANSPPFQLNRVVFQEKMREMRDGIEIDKYTNVLATEHLRTLFDNGAFRIPYDPAMLAEFAEETETTNSFGRTIYKVPSGVDHILSMFRCLGISLYLLAKAGQKRQAAPVPRLVSCPW